MRTDEIPSEDRPRERLKALGVEVLSVRELVAVVIGSGSPRRCAMDVAEDVVSARGDRCRDLAGVSVEKLARVDGVGEAKACRLKAAVELGRRVVKATRGEVKVVRCPEDAASLVIDDMKQSRPRALRGDPPGFQERGDQRREGLRGDRQLVDSASQGGPEAGAGEERDLDHPGAQPSRRATSPRAART